MMNSEIDEKTKSSEIYIENCETERLVLNS